MKIIIQWWLAELNEHGIPSLHDGPHTTRAGAEEARTILKRLGFVSKDRKFAVAEVRLSKPTGKHGPLDEKAIKRLNKMGLKER